MTEAVEAVETVEAVAETTETEPDVAPAPAEAAITSEAELRALLGEPAERAINKERVRLTQIDRQWLAASPLCFLATSDELGNCDVSPKGDPPGFVKVLADDRLAIPERPGNKRADGYHNILRNPHVGLIFVVPGRGDTLRINGRARLVREAAYFDDMVVKGHRPIMALEVEIEQIFFHCSKAFLRSAAWKPQTWNPDLLPHHAAIVKAVQWTRESLEELTEYYGESYEKSIYVTKK